MLLSMYVDRMAWREKEVAAASYAESRIAGPRLAFVVVVVMGIDVEVPIGANELVGSSIVGTPPPSVEDARSLRAVSRVA